MYEKELPVLLVDDEPDVLSVSKLAMRNFEVFGMPITLYTAQSKAEAIEMIHSKFSIPAQPGALLNLAFIDVVMETDTAGLELCDYIRNTLKNKFTQIYIRTGQPGVAPEREVVDRYDINGYFTKVEATPDKLYSLVKSSIRQAYFSGLALTLSGTLHRLILASGSRDTLADALQRRWSANDVDFVIGYVMEDRILGRGRDAQGLQALVSELDAQPGIQLGDGDKYVVNGKQLLVKIAGGPATAPVSHIVVGYAPPADFFIPLIYGHVKSIAALWKKAGEGSARPSPVLAVSR
jgi:CheY-like chemotaxis protein